MRVLGIESSCDECSAAVVDSGLRILSLKTATQIDHHKLYQGVVPEIASRLHTEWIATVVEEAISEASLSLDEIDAVAVTNQPGLIGSLMVGLSFAKGLAFARGVPYVGVDHILAHLYAPFLENDGISYPHLGVVASGGHTLICQVLSPFEINLLGTTVDDACGEAFDKVAAFHNWGYPGGLIIDRLSQKGDPTAFALPKSHLHKEGYSPYDISYSGLKTATIYQLDQFWNGSSLKTPENIAASFQKAAIDSLIERLERAVAKTKEHQVVLGGGVVANSYFRSRIDSLPITAYYPSLPLCGDNGAMIAGLGFRALKEGVRSDFSLPARSRSLVKTSKKERKEKSSS